MACDPGAAVCFDGPALVGGVRGAIERNAVRYFLALQAHSYQIGYLLGKRNIAGFELGPSGGVLLVGLVVQIAVTVVLFLLPASVPIWVLVAATAVLASSCCDDGLRDRVADYFELADKTLRIAVADANAKAEEIVAAARDDLDIPGLSYVVVSDGEVIAQGGPGVADRDSGEPVDPDVCLM